MTRLGRSARELLNIADELKRRGVQLCILDAKAQGKLLYTVLSATAEFERNMLSQRIRDGIASPKRRAPNGKYRRSRPPSLDAEKTCVANDFLEAGRLQSDVATPRRVPCHPMPCAEREASLMARP